MLIGAGLRIGEAIALEWRDIDWDGSAVQIARAAERLAEVAKDVAGSAQTADAPAATS